MDIRCKAEFGLCVSDWTITQSVLAVEQDSELLLNANSCNIIEMSQTEGGSSLSVRLPDATTLEMGHELVIHRADATSRPSVPVNSFGAVKVIDVSARSFVRLILRDNSTQEGVWTAGRFFLEPKDPPSAKASFALGDWVLSGTTYSLLLDCPIKTNDVNVAVFEGAGIKSGVTAEAYGGHIYLSTAQPFNGFAVVTKASRYVASVETDWTGSVRSMTPSLPFDNFRLSQGGGSAYLSSDSSGDFAVSQAEIGPNLFADLEAHSVTLSKGPEGSLPVEFLSRFPFKIVGSIRSIAVGEGIVYFGGDSNVTVGGIPYHGLFSWDGTNVAVIGQGIPNGSVSALALSATGRLYVGGTFSEVHQADTTPVLGSVAFWDGTSFQPVITDNVNVFALAADNTGNGVFIGGYFQSLGGIAGTKSIAVWREGQGILSLDGGISGEGTVFTLCNYADVLYVGGQFTAVRAHDPLPVQNILAYDLNNNAWSSTWGTDTTPTSRVFAITMHNGSLYIAGKFNSVGGTAAQNIIRLDMIAGLFLPMGSGIDSAGAIVQCLAGDGNRILIGGDFTSAGGVSCRSIATWSTETETYSRPCFGIWSDRVFAIGVTPSVTFACGDFLAGTDAALPPWGGLLTDGQKVLQSITALDALSGGEVRCSVINGDVMYIGGRFTEIRGVAAKNVAKVNLATLEVTPLLGGVDGVVYALEFDAAGSLYIGGLFSTVNNGGQAASNVVKWTAGGSFVAMGSGCNALVRALELDVATGRMYMGGDFTVVNGISANRICYRLGADFFALGTGANGPVHAICARTIDILIGGNFTSIGGVSANNFASWNGTFSAAADGVDAIVDAIVDADTTFIIGGAFQNRGGGGSCPYLAYWMPSLGTTGGFAPLGSLDGPVATLAKGPSNAVYVGGAFAEGLGTLNGQTLDMWGHGCRDVLTLAYDPTRSQTFVGGSFSEDPIEPFGGARASILPLGTVRAMLTAKKL